MRPRFIAACIVAFLVAMLAAFNLFAQSTVPIRGDTIRVYKQGDTANLKVDSNVYITGRAVIGRSMTNNASASLFLSDTAKALKYNNFYTRNSILNPVDGMRFYEDSTEKFLRRENGAWLEDGSGVAGAFINDANVHQTAKAYFDSLKLHTGSDNTSLPRGLMVVTHDSLLNDHFAYGGAPNRRAFYRGLMTVRDWDTSSAANDAWGFAINANMLVERITNINPLHSTLYRHNFVSHQIYQTRGDYGAQGGYVNSLGGDNGSAGKFIMQITADPNEPAGAKYLLGGSIASDAVPGLVSSISTFRRDGTPATTVHALGWWSPVVSYHNLRSGDSLQYFHYFHGGGFSDGGKFDIMTGAYIPITPNAGQTRIAYGVYAPDPLDISRNLFGGRVGIGNTGFGTEVTPTFDTSAQLQINSTTRGFLPPRMTAAQRLAIITPAVGLEVTDLDSLGRKMIHVGGGVWKGVAWTSDGGSGGGSGTVTDFIFTDGNGFDGTVTTSTTTPTLSLTTTVTNRQVMFSNSTAIAGSADFTWSVNDELFLNNTTDRGDYDIQVTRGIHVENVATNTAILLGFMTAGIGNYITLQNTGSSVWDLIAGGGTNLGLGSASGEIIFSTAFTVAGRFTTTGNFGLEKKLVEYNNAAAADGQIPIGGTAAGNWTMGTITAGTGITVTNGNNSITIASTALSNPMVDVGDMIYGGASGTPTRLGAGGGGTGSGVLLSISGTGSAVPTWTGLSGAWGEVNTSVTDANYTIVATDYYVELPTITANRTVTLPSASTFAGRYLILRVTNSAGFAWQPSPAIKDADDTDITSLTNDTVYILFPNGTNWVKIK